MQVTRNEKNRMNSTVKENKTTIERSKLLKPLMAKTRSIERKMGRPTQNVLRGGRGQNALVEASNEHRCKINDEVKCGVPLPTFHDSKQRGKAHERSKMDWGPEPVRQSRILQLGIRDATQNTGAQSKGTHREGLSRNHIF